MKIPHSPTPLLPYSLLLLETVCNLDKSSDFITIRQQRAGILNRKPKSEAYPWDHHRAALLFFAQKCIAVSFQ